MSRTLQEKRIFRAGSEHTTAGGSVDFINSYSSQCRQAARDLVKAECLEGGGTLSMPT
jgi:hypothetical protein